jgi:hypothetical protein
MPPPEVQRRPGEGGAALLSDEQIATGDNRADDTVKISRRGKRPYKLADGRVFNQRGGWLISRGRKSPIRARKVEP